RLLEPLARLIDGTAALAAGSYDRRLPVPEQRDLAELAGSINRMTERVEDQIAVVREERDHLHAILASMSEGVLVVDGDGRAVLANPAFRALFGAPVEVAGRPPLELTRQPELAAVVRRTLDEGEARHEELLLEVGAEQRSVALAGARLRSAGGNGRPGGVVVARDTTELTRVAQMRRDFVANVSHELKTPLSAIRGFAETLRDGALGEPETAERFTERILEQCRRLQEMLDDLLILSRLESVEIPLESRPVDLVRLVEKALETISAFADEHSVELAAELPEGELPRVTGDPWALERLLLNLLENGVKYNREGGTVQLSLDVAVGEAGVAEAVIEVSDTGIGIPSEALPRIFERFYRVDKGRARDEGGTGLGLAIVKHVAQAHGGRVEVSSRPRHGSTFRLHLPATSA
ncbi:MAG TPA: ATP-binding protein, partial [Thermoanaerobaculia bacterium]|nr:ATP-binding protein [Thermoanaerobaculia bacterium]